MANIFVTLNVPAGNGTGTAADVSGMGADKTFICTGAFEAAVNIEVSEDNSTWGPAAYFSGPGFQRLTVTARFARVRISGYVNGTPGAGIGADDAAASFVALNVPAGDGAGTASATTNFGDNKSVVTACSADWVGTITLEGSVDGTSYAPIISLTTSDRENFQGVFRLMRVRISGFKAGTATVSIGGVSDEGEGGTGDSFDLEAVSTNTTTITAYIDGTNGNDANNGLSTTTALQSIAGFYSKFPFLPFNGARIIVNFAGTGGFGTSATAQLTYNASRYMWMNNGERAAPSLSFRGPAMVPFTPATGPSTAALDAVPAVAVGNRTRFDFTTAAPAWTANDLAGRFLRITRAGAKVFFELPISENDADQIFVDSLSIVGNVLNTDTVTIVQPGVLLTADSGSLAIGGIGGTLFFYTAAATVGYQFERLAFPAFFIGGVSAGFDRCQFTSSIIVASSQIGLVNCAARGSGTSNFNCSGYLTTQLVNSRADAVGTDPISATAGVGFTSWGMSVIVGFSANGAPCNAYIDKPLTVSGLTSATSAGVSVYDGSSFVMRNLPDVPLQGNNNTGYGIKCWNGGRARVGAGAATTITGAAGALIVQGGAAIALGTGAGQFEDAASWNGNFTRMLEGLPNAPTGTTSIITTFPPF